MGQHIDLNYVGVHSEYMKYLSVGKFYFNLIYDFLLEEHLDVLIEFFIALIFC